MEKINFKRKVLKNGMTIIFEKRDLPIVSVAFAVRMGGINETENEKGISHFIEHLLYKGTPARNSRDIAREIEKRGGILNGFTSEEMTAYWCKMPSEHLKVALDVLSDMVKNPLFDENEIVKERQVIFEEMSLYKDSPPRYVMESIQKNLFDGTLSIPLIGTKESMNSINREQIVDKFKKTYTPNNMILCVIGDANFDEICKFAESSFGNEKGEIPTQKISEKNTVSIEERKGIDQANLMFAYHVPKRKEDLSYAAEILTAIMASGMSSKLFEEIREKRNLAYSVKGYSEICNDFSFNSIFVGTKKENVEKVKKIILEEFEKLSVELTEEDLQKIKTQLIGNHKLSMEDSQNQMVSLISSEIDGNAEEFYDFEEKIQAVKLDDVKNLAAKVKNNNYSFFALVPE